jgi:hypothetical protein
MNDVFAAAGATTYPLIRPQRSMNIGVIFSPHFGLREGQGKCSLCINPIREKLCASLQVLSWSLVSNIMQEGHGRTRQHL